METLFTFSQVYFLFANFGLEIVQWWSGVTKNKVLMKFCSQNTSLFGVKMSDYY